MSLPMAGRSLPLRAAIGAAALLAPAALASQASAVVIVPTAGCYVNARHEAAVTILGSGFTPGDDIAVNGNGFFAHATALPNGTVAVRGGAPILPTSGPAVRRYTLSAQDESAGSAVLATTTIAVTNFAVSVTPSTVKHLATDKVRYRFSGFRPGRHIYAYFRRKETLGRFTFPKAAKPCGTDQARALIYPGGHPGHDKYTVTFEQSSRFSKTAIPRVSTILSIIRF
jgi:hypothetical protein